MTDDWLTCTKPDTMLKAIGDTASGRKLRLIACAACRLLEPTAIPVWVRELLDAVEDATEGRLTAAESRRPLAVARQHYETLNRRLAAESRSLFDDAESTAGLAGLHAASESITGQVATAAVGWAERAMCGSNGQWTGRPVEFRSAVSDFIREIIGPLSHPLVLMSGPMLRTYGGPAASFRACVTDTARSVAEGVAADLAFDRLPILADALEDAGLDDRVLLDHLRYGTGHVRGCWALDLVLGRA
jgi:hypothetical protein